MHSTATIRRSGSDSGSIQTRPSVAEADHPCILVLSLRAALPILNDANIVEYFSAQKKNIFCTVLIPQSKNDAVLGGLSLFFFKKTTTFTKKK